MPNDFTVHAITAVRAASDATGESKAAVVQPLPQPGHTLDPSPIPNPSLRLDAALGLVVIEFRNDSGAITTSIPSQRQLEAYQRWDVTRVGPKPIGIGKPAPRAPPAPTHVPEAHVHAAPAKATTAK